MPMPGLPLPVPKAKLQKGATSERLKTLESRVLILELELSLLRGPKAGEAYRTRAVLLGEENKGWWPMETMPEWWQLYLFLRRN